MVVVVAVVLVVVVVVAVVVVVVVVVVVAVAVVVRVCARQTRLHVSHNALEALPQGLLALGRLRDLDVSYNRLRALPEAGPGGGWADLPLLTRLSAEYNALEALPADLGGAAALLQLSLHRNELAVGPACGVCVGGDGERGM